MLGNTEGAIKNEQCRETGNIGYTRRKKTKQKHNTMCWTPICANKHNQPITYLFHKNKFKDEVRLRQVRLYNNT
jgi:hypothetical protein